MVMLNLSFKFELGVSLVVISYNGQFVGLFCSLVGLYYGSICRLDLFGVCEG